MTASAKVLLVDDDPYARGYVRTLLEKIGVRFILEAANGHEAQDLIRTNGKTDLVFLDVNMDPGNGLEFLKNIRTGQTDAPRNQPIIMMSVNGEENVLGTAMALDCNAYLRKPVSVKEIADKMLRVLGQPTSARPVLAYDVVPVPALEKKKDEKTEAVTGLEEKTDNVEPTRKSGKRFTLPKGKKKSKTRNEKAKQSLFSKFWRNKEQKIEDFYENSTYVKPTNQKTGMQKRITLRPEALLEGDVLAQDVHTQSGVLLLAHGTELNDNYIDRLLSLRDSCGSLTVKVSRIL